MFGRKILKTKAAVSDIENVRKMLENADAVVIGAGAGLSASAGFLYTGSRFEAYFQDFSEKYHFNDMYSGGFYPYQTPEEHWAYWSRYIYINRYMDPPKPVYQKLYDLVKEKEYFVLTTNVDHCFQKAGFDKRRLFYTQGDYGLFQCGRPCHPKTYDNASVIRKMVLAQGYTEGADKTLILPEGITPKMTIPSNLIPYCPICGEPMSMNLRSDDTFVEDEGWRDALERYAGFLHRHKNKYVLFFEAAVGFHTPAIIKYNFWRMTHEWKNAAYVCLNDGEACAPDEIRKKSICINGDIEEILSQISKT